MGLVLNNIAVTGQIVATADVISIPVPAAVWTQGDTQYAIVGDTATPLVVKVGGAIGGTNGYGFDVLHGPLLPAGTYIDILLSSVSLPGSNPYITLIGATDSYGGFNLFTTNPYVAWYGGTSVTGNMYRTGLHADGAAPSNLAANQRYRIASKAGGDITWSRVSLDGASLVGSSVTRTMDAGYNASTLHLMVLPQADNKPFAVTAYPVQSGSGGL